MQYGLVSPEDGKFLQILVQASKAKNVLEIGTGLGFSSLHFTLGLRQTGGRLTTIEIDSKRVRMARRNFENAGVEDIVTLIEGDALAVLPTLKQKFDVVFSDALKEDNLHYFDLFLPLVREGGLIVHHDVNPGGFEACKMRDFLDMLKAHPCLDSVLVADATFPHGIGGQGLAVSYKRCSGLDGKPWSRSLARSVVHAAPSNYESSTVKYESLGECRDSFGNSRPYLYVKPGTRKKEVIALCKALIQKYDHQIDFTVHIYDDTEAYRNRDVFTYPKERYFSHLIAEVSRFRNAKFDEIRYFPEALLLLIDKRVAAK